MPRNAEKNERVREARREQILDAALTVYTRLGYYGADMDAVAGEAGLAKGLLYYYFKTKKELFTHLFAQSLEKATALSDRLLADTEGLNPVEALMVYTGGVFRENAGDCRLIRFCIRLPFDACAVFGPEGWTDGAARSDAHRRALENLIRKGITQGMIPDTNPASAAGSFWSVFVANTFAYSRLMAGQQTPQGIDRDAFRAIVRFCFQGLGVENDIWKACLNGYLSTQTKRGKTDETV